MTSDRMMQAIGRIDRAITRLETTTGRGRDLSARQADEIGQLKAALLASENSVGLLQDKLEQAQKDAATGRATPLPLPEPDPHAMNPFSHDKALAALRSLDSLIDDLQKARRDG